jgi:hypothetical protein
MDVKIPRLEMASMDVSKVGWLSYDSSFLFTGHDLLL